MAQTHHKASQKQAKVERIRDLGVPARRFRGPRRKKNAPPDRTVLQIDGFLDPQIDILAYFMLIFVQWLFDMIFYIFICYVLDFRTH